MICAVLISRYMLANNKESKEDPESMWAKIKKSKLLLSLPFLLAFGTCFITYSYMQTTNQNKIFHLSDKRICRHPGDKIFSGYGYNSNSFKVNPSDNDYYNTQQQQPPVVVLMDTIVDPTRNLFLNYFYPTYDLENWYHFLKLVLTNFHYAKDNIWGSTSLESNRHTLLYIIFREKIGAEAVSSFGILCLAAVFGGGRFPHVLIGHSDFRQHEFIRIESSSSTTSHAPLSTSTNHLRSSNTSYDYNISSPPENEVSSDSSVTQIYIPFFTITHEVSRLEDGTFHFSTFTKPSVSPSIAKTKIDRPKETSICARHSSVYRGQLNYLPAETYDLFENVLENFLSFRAAIFDLCSINNKDESYLKFKSDSNTDNQYSEPVSESEENKVRASSTENESLVTTQTIVSKDSKDAVFKSISDSLKFPFRSRSPTETRISELEVAESTRIPVVTKSQILENLNFGGSSDDLTLSHPEAIEERAREWIQGRIVDGLKLHPCDIIVFPVVEESSVSGHSEVKSSPINTSKSDSADSASSKTDSSSADKSNHIKLNRKVLVYDRDSSRRIYNTQHAYNRLKELLTTPLTDYPSGPGYEPYSHYYNTVNEAANFLLATSGVKIRAPVVEPVNWTVELFVHSNSLPVCHLVRKVSDAHVYVTSHGFQDVLVLFQPLASLFVEIQPYSYSLVATRWWSLFQAMLRELNLPRSYLFEESVADTTTFTGQIHYYLTRTKLIDWFCNISGSAKGICRLWHRSQGMYMSEAMVNRTAEFILKHFVQLKE